MSDQEEQMGEVIVTANNKGSRNHYDWARSDSENSRSKCRNRKYFKTLPVNSNNELSTQYAVRGGNYDEFGLWNRSVSPVLVRSVKQEGLSFTNTDLVQNVDFSAGGFQALATNYHQY
jgi:hypothetical protein